MAIRMEFDNTHNIIQPTFVLATRNGTKLGAIITTNESLSDNMNSHFELRFDVHKADNDNENDIWNKLQNFRLIWCREWDIWFEAYVEIQEDNELVKSVECVSLGEAELSQILLHNIEINTETDIDRDDYVPTVLFNDDNHNASLLHRIMEKAPHYSIHHVDSGIANIQRTFTFDNTSIYDAFQDIAEEINCIFVFDSSSNDDGSIKREINVYDLESYCLDCGHRGDFRDVCPECESANVLNGYGEDTTIFVSVENLADQITYTTDTDSVKNCFKLEAGDDLMTATVMNCNPNGSGYVWYISDDVKADMSDELVAKLNDYDALYEYYQNEHTMTIPSTLLSQYNGLVTKYHPLDENLTEITNPITGYSQLMNIYYDTIEFYLLLHDTLMPTRETSSTSAAAEAAKLTAGALSPVAVQNINTISVATASNAVLSMAKVLVNPNYQVKVGNSALNGTVWSGDFVVTNYSDSEDTAVSETISITINGNYETFIRQKIDKSLNSSSNNLDIDATSIFKLGLDDFKNAIKRYCLASLTAFSSACQSCMELLIEQGIADNKTWANKNPNMYEEVYLPYYRKMEALQNEIKLRESEINIITGTFDINGGVVTDGVQTILERHRNSIQAALNFEEYIGSTLWLEFNSYRREDVYSNSNYISDGLNNAELFKRANEFIESASREAFKSATLQHSISASLKDLLVMEEFAPIVDKFAVGNWIRVKVNDEVFRLRLISYTVDFTKLDSIDIEFSDVKKYSDSISDSESILSQAASMASSYDAVSRQASQGSKANRQISYWVNDSLSLTKMKIVDSADNQNITWDEHGLLCREYLPITDDYSDKQLKIINKGIYVTDDGWLTSKAGLGDFTYFNPDTGLYEEGYGVIADTIVGNIILGDNIGIYNESGAFKIDENGLTLTSSVSGDNENIFTIQRDNGDDTITKYMYIDRNGDVVINANSVRIASLAPQQSMSSYIESTAEEVASNTASDVLEEWVEGDFTETIHELQDGIVDAKIETYYQTSDPSTAWTTSAMKSQHAGDIWYNSTASIQKYYRWDGTAWEEMRATPPKAILDTVDGKATIYTGTSSPSGMHDGDLWFEGTDKPILTYVNGQWVEFNKYSAAIQGVQTYAQSIGAQVDGMAEIHYGTVTPKLNNAPANAWSDNATKDLHVDDLYYNTSDGYCYRFTKNGSTYSWERIKDSDITAAASAASDANDLADQKRRVFVSQPTPPYDAGDLWVEGENGDIWRCATPKITGQSFAPNDWVKASKYTDDSAAEDAYSYAQTVMEYAEGISGLVDDMVEIHYGSAIPTLSNAPANSWSNNTTKDAHLNDLYYDTTTGYCYRFTKSGSTYSWSRLKDKDITEAASLAGQKKRVFVGTTNPTPPYDVGDLWAQGSTGDIMKCKTARASGSYVASDWEKASKYTDDTALTTWIQGDFAQTIEDLQDGIIDAKVETWYQTSDPSTAWTTSALKSQHAGDIWYNSTSTVQKYYRWSGTAWEEMRATPPKAVMDEVDGKATIFTGTDDTPTGMQEGDLWFKGANEPILTYVGGQWQEYNKYTAAINGVKTYAESLGSQVDGMAEIHYGTITPALNTAPANSWSDTATKDLHVDDLYYNTTNGYCYRFTKSGSAYSWERIKDSDITAAASAASNANDLADQKRRVFVTTPTPPYDTGDLWVEGSTGDIWRCANPKILGQSYAKSDWVKASKYTDDSAATAAMTYAEDVMDYAEGLGGLIDEMVEIHYGTAAPTLSNAPANTWSDTATKDSHLDDLYYDTATGYCYRFTKSGSTYSWSRLKDKDITAAANLAGQKRRVFVNQPYTPYEVGDLWVQGVSGDIMKCKTARATGNFVESDWEKASKYTDDSALETWIQGDFAQTIGSLQDGITDAKVETWYQTSDPSTAWNTSALKSQHAGDIWYNSTSTVQKYYRWSGTAWQEMTASPPKAVMDSIDGKATIFTGATTPASPSENDLWFKSQDDPILTYVNGEWVEYNKYTTAIENIKVGGRNIIRNTLVPKVSDNASKPNIGGDTTNGYLTIGSSNSLTTAEHGVSCASTKAIRPILALGTNSVSTGLHGLIPGKTYTLSFDWSAKVYSGNPSTSTTYYLRTYIYYADSDDTALSIKEYSTQHTYNKNELSDRGAELSGRTEYTFAVPEDAVSVRIVFQPNSTTNSHYATGDYIEMRNIKLEAGNKATDWTPAPEDMNAQIETLQEYADSLSDQVDGMAEIHYGTVAPTLSNAPANSWSSTDAKDSHVDDLYYDTATGYCYRFTKSGSTYSWERIKDSDIASAASAASAANTLAGQKRRVFVSQPYTPYESGDLWVQGINGDIMRCINPRATGNYVASDWEKASKYTDDTYLTTWINGTFVETIQDLQDGIADAKVETWYQTQDPSQYPSPGWNTTDLKNLHKGDIWYNSTSSVQKYYRWSGTVWEEMRATPPEAVMDEVDGKATIFTGTDPAPSGMHEGDLWFKGQDEPILTYINGQWVEYNKYTDDSAVNNLQIGGRNLLYDTNAPSLIPTGVGGCGLRYFSNAGTISTNGVGTEWTTISDAPISGIKYGAKHVCTQTGGQNHMMSFYQAADRIDFVPGVQYTISYWVKSSVSGALVSIGLSGNAEWDRTTRYDYTIQNTDTWEKVSVTFTYLGTSSLTAYNQQNTILYVGFQYNVVGTVWCCGYQVEEGNVATAWSEYSYTQTSYGGRNLIRNTNKIDLSSKSTRPNINGYYDDEATMYGSLEYGYGTIVATDDGRGFRYTGTAGKQMALRLGTSNEETSSRANGLFGLEAGETYTYSFDVKCKISTNYTGTAMIYLGAYLYSDIKSDGTQGETNKWNADWFSYPITYYPGELGTEKSAHVVFTFTIPVNAQRVLLSVRPASTNASYVGAGDYIEMRNLKLERGNKATDWTPAPEDVDNAINSIEIGGRNLLLGTQDWSKAIKSTTTGGEADGDVWTFPAKSSLEWSAVRLQTFFPSADYEGQTLTISFDYRSDDFSDTSGTHQVYLTIDGSASESTTRTKYRAISISDFNGVFVPTTSWKRGSITFTYSESMLTSGSGTVNYFFFQFFNYTLNSYQLRHVKLEKGNKATDWTPAPEDVDKSIQDYVADLQEQIDGKAETWYQEGDPSTTWTTDDLKKQHSGDLWYRPSDGATFYYMVTINESTGIVVSAEWIERTVPTEVFNAINGKAQIFTSVPSNYNKGDLWIDSESGDILVSINANEEFVEEDWVKASKYTDDSNIGDGKNLIINTNIIDITDIENLPRIYDQPIATRTSGDISGITKAEHGFRVTTPSASRVAIRFGSNEADKATMNGLTAGETYTLSFDSKWKMCSAQSDDKQMYVWLHDDRATTGSLEYTPIHSFGTVTPNVDVEGRCECTFTIPENVTMCNIYISANSSTAAHYAPGDYLELSNIKLEKGGRATAWTPAVEDILKQFESIDSSIAQTNETVNDLQDNIETWMNFDGEALTIGKKYEATATEDAVEFATVIDSESLSFTQNGNRVAYINSNKLFIENAEITTNLAIGNYLFKPHEKDANGVSDGGMSLVWNA